MPAADPAHRSAHHPVPLPASAALQAALLAHRQGDLAAADTAYRRALAADPGLFEALQGLAVALLQRGDPAAAAPLLREAVARRPDAAEAHNMLGLALAALDRHDEAVSHYRTTLALRPGLAGAHDNLGLSLMALVQPAAALEQYQAALILRPGHAALHDHLGTALAALGRHDEALAHFAAALARDPDAPLVHLHRGSALHARGDRDAALAAYRRALALAPDLADAFANIGIMLEEQGDLSAAAASFGQAIDAAPCRAPFYYYLSDLHRFELGDRFVVALEELAEHPRRVAQAERPHVHFALGKAKADLADHAAAFRHIAAGNRLQRARIAYDEAATLAQFDRIRAVFTAELLCGGAGRGTTSALPVFIVGMPRSGTTLVEQILAAHPCVFAGGERDALAQQAAGMAPAFPEGAAALCVAALAEFGDDYVRGLAAAAPPGRDPLRIIDKMPGNFRFLGLIRLALPRARIIHVRRDPVDTCVSCFSKLFTGSQPYAYELGELGRYYRGYRALMAHWRAALPAGAMLEIDYEALVDDLAGAAHHLVDHCGLDWNPGCLEFHRGAQPVRTASAAQVRQPLYRSAIGRSRPYRPWLGPLLDALGDLADE